jgi:hypothetical protein
MIAAAYTAIDARITEVCTERAEYGGPTSIGIQTTLAFPLPVVKIIRMSPYSVPEAGEESVFFFEKKNQKTLICYSATLQQHAAA